MCPDAQEPQSSSSPAAEVLKYAFVSYKREDQERVQPIVNGLRSHGLTVWWDEDIAAGASWSEEIETKLRDAGCVVVVWSKLSVGKEGRFVRDEVEDASKKGILVPLRIDDVRPPLGLREIEFVDLLDWDGDASDQRLVAIVNAVRKKLQLATTPPPAATKRWVRFLRRHRKPLIGVSAAAIALLGYVFVWRGRESKDQDGTPPSNSVVGADRTEVTRLLARLQNDARVSVAERAFAIDSLRTRKAKDEGELSAIHGEVVAFLAWRAKRTIPHTLCGSAASRAFADSLSNATDVEAALSFLRNTRRKATPLPRLRLDSSNLQRMNLQKADLRSVSFRASCLDSTQFSDAWLQSSTFSDKAEGRWTFFVRARLDSATFAHSSFVQASFYGACLKKANFAGAHLDFSTFLRATISWANFYGAWVGVVDGWNVVDTTASHAFFVGAKNLTDADEQWLTLHGAVVSGTNFGEWDSDRKRAVATGTAPSCSSS